MKKKVAKLGAVAKPRIKSPREGLKIAVVPDTQVKPGVDTDHLAAYGKYIAEKRPHVVVCIGDWFDMPSLSSYDKPGSRNAEGRRIRADLDAGISAMERFVTPFAKISGYSPAMHFTKGNHCHRADRAVNDDPRIEGLLTSADFGLEQFGWTVHEFLAPVEIGGVMFVHYLPTGVMGRPATSARLLVQKAHQSVVVGHQQGLQMEIGHRANGTPMIGIIAGSFYSHTEDFLPPTVNAGHWRGALFMHETKDGAFDPMLLSLNYLLRKFAPKKR